MGERGGGEQGGGVNVREGGARGGGGGVCLYDKKGEFGEGRGGGGWY